jgi:hypothetical protein
MAYNITKTNGQNLMSIGEAVVDKTLGISLIGQNYHNYGELIANNFVRLLENQANNKQPLQPLEGQLWYDTTSKTLQYFDGGRFRPFASYVASTDTPVRPYIGDQWWNTTLNVLMIYTGTDWLQVATVTTVAAAINTALPKRSIILWESGTAVPAGWALCNGQNNTPNTVGMLPGNLLVYIMKTTG